MTYRHDDAGGETPTSENPDQRSRESGLDGSPAVMADQPISTGARSGGVVREIVETALIAIAIFLLVRVFVLNFRVDGSSMTPSLVNGEMLLVNRNAYETYDLYSLVDWLPFIDHDQAYTVEPFGGPNRGDVVIFEPPVDSSKPYIKRVIAVAGDTVEIRDGAVFVNGEMLDEPYLGDVTTECGSRNCGPLEIAPGEVFVLGDNRPNSSDSRFFGAVAEDSILGEAWLTYWPLREIGLVD